MNRFGKGPRPGLRRHLASWGLMGALACGVASVNAQPTPAPARDSAGSAVEDGASHTRSLFLGTIASLIAQNVGNGVGTALSAGLSGSITRWFNGEPAVAAAASAATPDVPQGKGQKKAAKASQRPAELHAGVAYEIHRIDDKGVAKAIDPARHTFRTGDRFQVFYRPSLPGRVKVININPDGRKSRIDAVNVAAGELVTLGPYQFVDTHGTETLRLVLEPCSTAALTASTRSIIKTTTAAPQEKPGVQIRDCADIRPAKTQVATRSIRKTTVEGSTAYALDRLSDEERQTGIVAPRSVQIRLKHRS